MIKVIEFDPSLYSYFKNNKSSFILKSKHFNTLDETDRQYFINISSSFKKWVYQMRSFDFDKRKINVMYFDLERMIVEHSILAGNQSYTDKIESTSNSKNIEGMIEDSFKELEKHNVISKMGSDKYINFFEDVGKNQTSSFIINCIPNTINGNYVNIPTSFVSIKESFASIENNEEYFFRYLDRLPLKINEIQIGGDQYINIVNTSIVPMFIDLGVTYFSSI